MNIEEKDFICFKNIEQVTINKKSKYFIMCSNINHKDPWVWKYCNKENNFTPVFSEEYGDCSILGKDLPEVMKHADHWITKTRKSNNIDMENLKYDDHPVSFLYLLKIT